ncbi:MAG: tRNA uridine(34) 5-carboxymethylaminomethyl modification radical SAM/GNAT enzyme Elp3 [Patescibacteria group bacterium]|jgi:elongator complex protein 3
MQKKKAIQEIIKIAEERQIKTPNQLRSIKAEVVSKYGIIKLPTDVEILKEYRKKKKSGQLFELLKIRKIRTLSGVAVIAVLTKPYPCPGNCLYCPSQKDMPKSYLNNEPAVMRAVLNKFDPYKQVHARLRALHDNGHETDKCELIVMGGTWSFLPHEYQTWFVKRCFDAFNEKTSKNLEQAKKLNEKANHRVIGLTLETRPDYINEKEAQRMRELGATRVELGIQSVYDSVLKINKRGHNIKTAKNAIKILRDQGFKITFHMMPNLPGSNLKKDLEMFKVIFSNPAWQPDQIKIYPCVVTKDSELYTWWKKGKYKPYTEEQLIKLLTDIKKIVPPYVRIARLIRDIPEVSIMAGNKITNLRQILQQRGVKCQCIRCREPRLNLEGTKDAMFTKRKYKVTDGEEIFLSYETKKNIYAFCRLHLGKIAIIRELHTYGQMTPVFEKGKAVQHLGFGKKLLKKAEEIAKQKGYNKLSVISGVGAREYYRKLGYGLEKEYMVKCWRNN